MKLKNIYFLFAIFSALIIVGCSNKAPTDNGNNYEDAKAAAWEFINEKGWIDQLSDGAEGAKVDETIANKNKHVLLDDKYEGQEVLIVSFEDADDAVTGTPLIFVDPDTNDVIGYMPGE